MVNLELLDIEKRGPIRYDLSQGRLPIFVPVRRLVVPGKQILEHAKHHRWNLLLFMERCNATKKWIILNQ